MNDACTCDACQALNARYESEPWLLAHYREKLLIRGWAGRTDDVEKAYIVAHADWARGAAERGRVQFAAMRAARPASTTHLSNPPTEMAKSGGVVVGATDAETGPIGRATGTIGGDAA